MGARTVAAGPLRLFQFFAGLQLGGLAITDLALIFHEQPDYHSWWQLGFMLVASAGLFGYLTWARRQPGVGSARLPIAIGLALTTPLVGQALLAAEGRPFDAYLSVSGEMSLFVLFPLLAVAERDSFRGVAGLALGVGLVDFLLTRLAYPDIAGSVEYGRTVFTRTLGYLAVGYLVTRLIGQQRAQRHALERANGKLAHYASTLEALAVSRERSRLARELHDTLAHTLSGLAIQLEAARTVWPGDPDQAKNLLDQALASTRGGLVETRRALSDLRASPLAELGLWPAVRESAERAARCCGARLDLDLPTPGWPPPPLAPEVEQGVFRFAQEALENVVRHAGAGHLLVRLGLTEGALTLTVADDGVGFDPYAVDERHHLGLLGLRERARLIGAVLELESHPGAGTRLTLSVPAVGALAQQPSVS